MDSRYMDNMSLTTIGYRIVAYTSLALAVAGIVLPLLPTTPFVLLAAWSAGRSSPAFRYWLEHHRMFGPIIVNWQQQRAVPLKAKWLACVTLLISWSILLWTDISSWVALALGVFFCGLLAFLFSRPSC